MTDIFGLFLFFRETTTMLHFNWEADAEGGVSRGVTAYPVVQ